MDNKNEMEEIQRGLESFLERELDAGETPGSGQKRGGRMPDASRETEQYGYGSSEEENSPRRRGYSEEEDLQIIGERRREEPSRRRRQHAEEEAFQEWQDGEETVDWDSEYYEEEKPRQRRREEEAYYGEEPYRERRTEESAVRRRYEEEEPRRRRYEEEEPHRRRYEEEEPRRRRYEEEEFRRGRYEEEESRRRRYEGEEPRRRRYDEEESRRGRYEEEESRRRRYEEEEPRRRRYEGEGPRRRRYEEGEPRRKKRYEEEEAPERGAASRKRRSSPREEEDQMPKKSQKKQHKKKHRLRKFLIAAVLIVALLGVGLYQLVGMVYGKMSYNEIASVSDLPMKEDGVVNILLIGNDSRDNSDDGRSDAMILVSVSSKTKTIYMTSLLRDMYVDIPGHDGNRLNAAYSYGGAELLMETVEKNFDIPVNRYMLVNFEAFANLVDAVGGIELELTSEEIEYVNGYLVEYNMLTGREQGTDNMDTSVSGLVQLNGPQALAYSRNRYLGTDFGRTERQRKVLTAVIKKLPSTMLTNSRELMDGLLPNLTTNLTKNECFQLSLMAGKLVTYDIVSDSIPQPGTYTDVTIRKMQVLQVDFEANIRYLKEKIYGE